MSLNLIWLVLFKKGVNFGHSEWCAQKENVMWKIETLLPQARWPPEVRRETEQILLYLQRKYGPVDSSNLGLLASSTVRQYISIILSSSVSDILWQQP